MYRILILLLMLVTSCASLKRVQRKENTHRIAVDSTITELVRFEVGRQIGTINQTVIEHYPPQYNIDSVRRIRPRNRESETPPETQSEIQPEPDKVIKPDKPPNRAINQPIKSIIITEVKTQSDKIVTTDSTETKSVVEHINTQMDEQIDEKPSNFVNSIKWIAIALGAVLLIIIAIKIL